MNNRQPIKQFILHITIIGAFSVVVMASGFYYGVTSGNDFAQHYQFAHTIHHSIVSGEVYPSWADSQNQGYGDAAIRFYPPFSYYLISVSNLILNDWYFASLFTFFLIFWFGGVGVYLWSKEEFSANQSLLAAGLFIFAPYHVNQIYNNFLYAEFASSAVIPFCFLFATRVCRRGKAAELLGLSISYALLLLTNLPLSVITSIALFIYSLSLLKKERALTALLKLAVSVIFALAASSFYWIRMLTELNWVKQSQDSYYSGIFDYRNNFLFAPQNILDFQSDTSVLWFADLMLLAMLLISIPSLILYVKNRGSLSRFSISIALLFLVSFLMTTPLSKAIWDNLSLLQKVQFPWRWLGILSAGGAIFAAAGIMRVAEVMNENKNHLLAIGLGVILTFYAFMSAFVIKQAVYLSREEFALQLQNIKSANSFNCWWTIWAKTEAQQIKEKLTIPERKSRIISWESTQKEFEISAGEARHVRVAIFYYPHWQANVNGQQVEIEKADDSSILIPLPGEVADVKLYFEEPEFVRFANFTSLGLWIFFLFALTIIAFQNRFKPA